MPGTNFELDHVQINVHIPDQDDKDAKPIDLPVCGSDVKMLL